MYQLILHIKEKLLILINLQSIPLNQMTKTGMKLRVVHQRMRIKMKVLKMNRQPLDLIQLVGRMPDIINIIINDNKNCHNNCHDIFLSLN